MIAPRASTIAKGDRIEVVAGQHRGATGEAFAVFPRVTGARVMLETQSKRILSVAMADARKIGGQK